MFVNVAILDGIKAEFFHCRNHFTSSFNIYYKFKLTEIIKTIQFSLRNEDFLHFVLTAMVAITMEICRAEYLLVAVDDDDFRKTNDDDVRGKLYLI